MSLPPVVTLPRDKVNLPAVIAWVAALRSGHYRQGIHSLNRNGQFCCLGVLCELAMEELPELERTVHEETGVVTYDGSTQVLPVRVAEWLGFLINDSRDPEGYAGYWPNPLVISSPDYGSARSLAEMNDSGMSFHMIADAIERTWLLPESE